MRLRSPPIWSPPARWTATLHRPARKRPPEAHAGLWPALLLAAAISALMPGATQAATAPRPPASLPIAKPRIPIAKVPLPVPRPNSLDAEIEADDAAEAKSQAAEAPPAPATFAFPLFAALAPAPAFAPPPPAEAAETAPSTPPETATLPRLANVPTPRPREPLPGEEQAEPEAEDTPAPALVAPPPPSGSAAPGAPPAAGAPAEVVAPGTLPALCAALVEQKALVATPAPPVAVKAGCALPAPVHVTAVRLADGNLVTLSPAAILQCEMAAAVTQWVREDLGPAVATLGTRMETFKVAASYDCRPRNRIKGAKMSEHGQGAAIDFGGFETADKRVIEVKNGGFPIALQERIKADACARFSTVLGPGSDGYHEDHIHVDIAKRRLDIKLCRWIIKTPAPALIAAHHAGQEGTGKDAIAKEAAGKDSAAAPEEAEAQEASRTLPDKVPLPLKRPKIKPGPKAAGDSEKLPGG
ncbi:extensin family protein [Roseixanthobacter glucoisosaccharinicivorans]|uniref:extensin family protein n=1 Tax=Roseixanthobacter glucoisosaccharinicivorans TaxID=3119923 RepID=UPI003728E85C